LTWGNERKDLPNPDVAQENEDNETKGKGGGSKKGRGHCAEN